MFALGYHEGKLKELVHRLKYSSETYLSDWLAAAFRKLPPPFSEADELVPVPLHPLRLAERGYNQSALIARGIGTHLGKRVLFNAAERTVATLAQASLSAEHRSRNVESSFRAQMRPGRPLAGHRVLVVDDVVTTGSTSEALKEALEQVGANVLGVLAVSVARPKTQ